MIPFPFEYVRATGLDHALAVAGADPEGTRALAGGTWLIPEMLEGRLRPRTVVDLGRAGLDVVRPDGEAVRIGPVASYADLLASEVVERRAPLLRAIAAGITGGPQIRNRASIGGAACQARPASDVPAGLVLAGATLELAGPRGRRSLPAGDFFVGAYRSALEPGELLIEVRVPGARPHQYFGYHKLKIAEGSWPIATAAARIEVTPAGRVGTVAVTLGAVAERPIVVEQEVAWELPLRPDRLASLATACQDAVAEPWSDELASGPYRRKVAGVVAARAVMAAAVAALEREEGNDAG